MEIRLPLDALQVQVKTAVSYHHSSITMAKIPNTDSSLVRLWSSWSSHSLLMGVTVQSLGNTVAVSYKPKHFYYAFQQSHPLEFTQMYSNLCSHKSLHRSLCSGFIHKFQSWQQPKCPLVSEGLTKLWYFQTMECYSTLRSNELSCLKKTQRNLQCVLLSERSLSVKAIWYLLGLP